jgi:transcriptional regulator with XRE-family HTH domain
MATFGQRLKAAMERRDVTIRELAKQMDVPERTVSRWREHARGPNISKCARIARVLGVPITDPVPTPRAEESVERSDFE